MSPSATPTCGNYGFAVTSREGESHCVCPFWPNCNSLMCYSPAARTLESWQETVSSRHLFPWNVGPNDHFEVPANLGCPVILKIIWFPPALWHALTHPGRIIFGYKQVKVFLKLQKVLMEGLKNRANTMSTPPAQISKANCRNGFAPCSLCHYYSRACSTAITLTILLIPSTVPLIFPIFLLTAISHDLLRFTYISLV